MQGVAYFAFKKLTLAEKKDGIAVFYFSEKIQAKWLAYKVFAGRYSLYKAGVRDTEHVYRFAAY